AARALVDGEPLAIIQAIGCPGCWVDEMEVPGNVTVLRGAEDHREVADGETLAACKHVLWVTDRLIDDTGLIAKERVLWYRPKSLVLGIGCERGISAAA